jgi:hypothetical protein
VAYCGHSSTLFLRKEKMRRKKFGQKKAFVMKLLKKQEHLLHRREFLNSNQEYKKYLWL